MELEAQAQKRRRGRKGQVVCVACGMPMKLILEQPVRKEDAWFLGNLAAETPGLRWFKCPRCQRIALYGAKKRS